MTERLSDVNARIASARQISSVVSAMRAIAAARMRDARLRLDSVRRYAQSVGQAISRTLPLASQAFEMSGPQANPGRRLIVAVGAEQGFAGGFSERVLRGVGAAGPDELLIVGDRAIGLARQLGYEPAWSAPAAAHLDQIEAIADQITEEIWSRANQGIATVSLIYAAPDGADAIVSRSLAPFDFKRFAHTRNAQPPLTQLAASALLAKLAEEYVFAELCEALTLSFAAENEARIRAMTAARGHVREILDALGARSRHLRQEEITNEIIELAVNRAVSRDVSSRAADVP